MNCIKKFILILLTSVISAFSDDIKGIDIMKKTYDLKKAENSYNSCILTQIDKKGNSQTQKMIFITKKRLEGTDIFCEILSPPDAKGMRFLNLAHQGGDDEQRIYIPALKKIKRISSSGKKSRFFGSDFYFYDMEDHDIDEFEYLFMSKIDIKNKKYNLVKAVPKDVNSPYSYIINYINEDDFFIYQQDCYNSKTKELEKVIRIDEATVIKGVILPVVISVVNKKNDHKTILKYDDIKINEGVSEKYFIIKNLKEETN